MERRTIFTSKGLIEEINNKTNNEQKNLYIEDMVNGAYYRCFGVEFDENENLVLRVKALEDLYERVIDLYTEL